MHKYVTSPVPPWFERSKKALGSVWLAFIWVLMEQIPAVGSNYHMYNANSMQLLFNPGNCNTKIWILSSRSNELKRRSNHHQTDFNAQMFNKLFCFFIGDSNPKCIGRKKDKKGRRRKKEKEAGFEECNLAVSKVWADAKHAKIKVWTRGRFIVSSTHRVL